MDFHELLNFAASKQENLSKTKNVPKYSLNLPAPKKEEKSKPKSAVIQSLLKEKEKEKEAAERALQEKQEEERKKNQFKIPKKKPEIPPNIDKETLISSLFDDGIDSPIDAPVSSVAGKTSSSVEHAPHKHSSDHVSNGKLRTSDNKHEHSHSKPSLENSCRKHEKHHSDKTESSSNKSKPHGETTHTKSSHSSSSSKHSHSSSNSTHNHSSSNSKHSHSSSNSKPSHTSSDSKPSHSSSNSKPGHSSSDSKPGHSSNSRPSRSSSSSKPSSSSHPVSNGVAKSVPANTSAKEGGDQKTSTMTEKEKILARLQAIKQRTLEAIHKENASKGRRTRGERSHRKSKNDEKQDDKAKSAEIVRDDDDSDDDDVGVSNVPSALDIMLSDRNAKLEKEKISRMAKQAWERATKHQSDTEEKVKKKSKKSSTRDSHSSHHKHKSSHKDKKVHSSSSDVNPQKAKVKHKHKIVKSSNAPPPMDFKAILAMAEQKQKAPPKPALPIPKKKKEEEERPLTQEEKDRKERQKSREYQEWLKKGGQRPGMKDETNVTKPAAAVTKTASSTSQPMPSFNKHSLAKPSQSDMNNKVKPKSSVVNENIISLGPEEEESDGEERSPLRDSTNPFDKIMQQVHKKRSAPPVNSGIPKKQSRILDSEEEDSDMDSFIDDGDCELDYSKEIQNIFGYNKNKPINTNLTFETEYKDEDDDLSDMEADFKTVMMEEKRSAKLGLMEDLEDMRKEQMEKAMKKKMLKKGK